VGAAKEEGQPAGTASTGQPESARPLSAGAAAASQSSPAASQSSPAASQSSPAASQSSPAASQSSPDVRERPAAALPGWPMLGGALVAAAAGAALVATGVTALVVIGAVAIVAAIATARGLTPVTPGEARVVQLFGRYAGTLRSDGLSWVNPAADRRKVSTRIRNHETTPAKVNDADGNPIEIAAVVVWQVEDTAKAVFGVDDLTEFVAVQSETAVRQIASDYPYDDHEGGMSLRGAGSEINVQLAGQIIQRVAPAGVKIIEARLTRLAYAQEIAHAMLRRQQAGAMVAARQKIVDGAVGMVESALARLDADGLVELDPERKAAMVSNMLVVLCSDHPTQPVVNTGTLYQ
jgi:regulator of protease activity HflC (stomatin/prohibitin superfamily)